MLYTKVETLGINGPIFKLDIWDSNTQELVEFDIACGVHIANLNDLKYLEREGFTENSIRSGISLHKFRKQWVKCFGKTRIPIMGWVGAYNEKAINDALGYRGVIGYSLRDVFAFLLSGQMPYFSLEEVSDVFNVTGSDLEKLVGLSRELESLKNRGLAEWGVIK